MPEQPIYLTGLDRTGKTPLRRMLDRQPWLAMRRGRTWHLVDATRSRSRDRGDVERYLRALVADEALAALDIDPAALRAAVVAQEDHPDIALLGRTAAALAARAGKPAWGEQGAEIDAHADAVFATYPGAFVVHLVRDPRDRLAESGRGGRFGGVGPATQEWLESVERALRNVARHGDRYRILRYEDLVAHPDDVLAAICRAVGRPYDASASASERPDPASVGRYREVLGPAAIRCVVERTGRRMAGLGYEARAERMGVGQGLWHGLWVHPLASSRTRLRAARGGDGSAPAPVLGGTAR